MEDFDDIFAEFEKQMNKSKKGETVTEEKSEETTTTLDQESKPETVTETKTEVQSVESEMSSEPETEKSKDSSVLDDFLSSSPTDQNSVVSVPQQVVTSIPTIESKPKEIVIQTKPQEFDFSEETGPGKTVVTIYGHKGHGKTSVALSFPGKIAAISFDRKTKSIAVSMYPDRDSTEIKVWDGKKYYDESEPITKLMSAEATFNYLIQLIDHKIREWEPDWILIDGTEIFQEICEMVMRYRNNLMPFQGIANRNLWKERRMYMRQIHNLALTVAKKGVIYSLYPKEHDIRIVDGEVMDRQEMPGWIDVVMSETDTVLKVEKIWEEGAKRVFVTVESNKSPIVPFKDGIKVDVTDKSPYNAIVEASKLVKRSH